MKRGKKYTYDQKKLLNISNNITKNEEMNNDDNQKDDFGRKKLMNN